jgi:hypothetical protein
LLRGSIYTKGIITGDRSQTAWKYNIPMKSWSPVPSPPGVYADDYVLAIYRSQLVWIGGRVHTGNEEDANKKVFVYEQDQGWKEDTSIPLLPDGLLHCSCLFASGDDNYLVVACDSKLLVFDGQQWWQKDGPGHDMRVLVHCGTLYLIIQENRGGSFCKVSVQSLLAEIDYDWEIVKLPSASAIKYFSLTVVGDHVTMFASIPRTLCILSLSSTFDSFIRLAQLKLDHYDTPSVVGCPNGKLLLMGLMKMKDPRSQNPPPAAVLRQSVSPQPQFKMIEMTPNGMLRFFNEYKSSHCISEAL